MINISRTKLSHLSEDTFRRLPALKILDLRWNQLTTLKGPFQLSKSFEQLLLKGVFSIAGKKLSSSKFAQFIFVCITGNPWNCLENLEWFILPEQTLSLSDGNQLSCGDRTFKDRHLITVMGYRVVSEDLTHPISCFIISELLLEPFCKLFLEALLKPFLEPLVFFLKLFFQHFLKLFRKLFLKPVLELFYNFSWKLSWNFF